ncbi:hypothetical protein [Rossellomorea sp. DUT-2]|uniref:hypothetical protein n=1 Tax=Rossellomorea sp. DUT-2 TaxID=3412021 RepID=UPI003D16799A
MENIEGEAGIFMGLLSFLADLVVVYGVGSHMRVVYGSFCRQGWIYQRNNDFISDTFNISAKFGLYQENIKFISE